MSTLKQFTGFKGVAAMAEIGGIRFFLMAANPRQLETLWQALVPSAGAPCTQKAILIEASLLPTPTGLHPSAQGCEERATLGNQSQTTTNPEGVASSPSIDV